MVAGGHEKAWNTPQGRDEEEEEGDKLRSTTRKTMVSFLFTFCPLNTFHAASQKRPQTTKYTVTVVT